MEIQKLTIWLFGIITFELKLQYNLINFAPIFLEYENGLLNVEIN